MPKLVNVIGFEPNVEQREVLRTFLNRMKRISPSQSTIEFDVEMKDSVFDVRVAVRSFHGIFEDRRQNADLVAALEMLKKGVGTKLMDWKVTRFDGSEASTLVST